MLRALYVATSNPGKLRDFGLAAARHQLAVLPLPKLETIAAPAEDAPTFAENALEKARYYSSFLSGEMVLADDSGLEVAAFDGAPGVRSARYAKDAGFHPTANTDANNNLYLLQQMAHLHGSERAARYWCALAVAQDGIGVCTSHGIAVGLIVTEPRGSNGFGYDPLFYVPALERTMAEVDAPTRWAHSHRGEAFRALLQQLG